MARNHPDGLAAAVAGRAADVGIAFDGDADRIVAVDHLGRILDGDQIMAMCATDMRDRGCLSDDTVVVTVMSNLGFRRAMADAGIEVVDTAVGDRHVLEALEGRGLSLGGEQSGHIVFRDLSTTGDGLLSAVAAAGPGPPKRRAAGRAGRRGHGAAPAGAHQRSDRGPHARRGRAARERIAAVEAGISATPDGSC